MKEPEAGSREELEQQVEAWRGLYLQLLKVVHQQTTLIDNRVFEEFKKEYSGKAADRWLTHSGETHLVHHNVFGKIICDLLGEEFQPLGDDDE